jgi:hypothetical protein
MGASADNQGCTMTNIPTRRTLLVLLAILVLGTAGVAAAKAMKPSAPRASAEWMPPAARPPTAPTGTRAPHQRGARAADSAAGPDSGLTVSPAPRWNRSAPPTCGQWQTLLSDQEQASYSTALLRAAWQNDGSSAIAPESTARSYRAAITAACLGMGTSNGNVSDVARVVYAGDPTAWRP